MGDAGTAPMQTNGPVGSFVTVDDTRVHYLQKGTGRDIVLIHGASGNLRDFTTTGIMETLSETHRVTAFDRPGLGYTERPKAFRGAFNTRSESPQEQAALLARAAEQIGISDPVVVGHSYGGAVAMAWGLDHDASAIVSLSGAIMPWPGKLDLQYRLLGSALGGAVLPPLAQALVPRRYVASAIESIFAPQSAPDGYAQDIDAALSLRPITIRANGRQVHALRPSVETLSKRYPSLDLPVELLHGDADPVVGIGFHARAANKLLPNARLTELPGIGHMPHHAASGSVLDVIESAISRSTNR